MIDLKEGDGFFLMDDTGQVGKARDVSVVIDSQGDRIRYPGRMHHGVFNDDKGRPGIGHFSVMIECEWAD
jgi:hypothetical protein